MKIFNLLVMVVLLLASQPVPSAYAQQTPAVSPAPAAQNNPPVDPTTCTTFKERAAQYLTARPPQPNEPPGILTEIFGFIKQVTGEASRNIFDTFVSNDNYQYAVYATFSLYIVIFGAMFTMGLVQATFGQVLIRLFRIGLIVSLIGPGGWQFFSEYVVTFFNDGTDQLISAVMDIAAGIPAGQTPLGISPFYRLDRIATFLINPDTLVALMGAGTSGVYALGMTGFMGLAFFGFLKLLIDALQTYAIAFVVRSMLLGLAPIFFVMLLFERTKGLFTGWVNLLVAFSLNPILLFTFLSFMVTMISSATENMLGGSQLCWVTTQQGEGVSAQKAFWRFTYSENGQENGPRTPYLLDWTFDGNMQCNVAGQPNQQCPQFPIKIIDVLTFFLLVWLAMRFSEVIDRISNELASTFASLSAETRLAQYMSNNNAEATMGGTGSPNRPAADQKSPTPSPTVTTRN